jgi:uncharacterized membrane protein
MSWLQINLHRGFGTFSYDVGLYDQGLWLLSRFEAPFVTLMGRNLFGDHSSLVLFLVLPLYWIAPGTETLLVVQSLVVAAGAIPTFLFARRVLASESLALLAGLVWLANPAVAGTTLENFHPDSFQGLFVPLALWALLERRWKVFALAVLLVLSVKEDAFLLVVPLGIWIAARVDRRKGLATVLAGLVAALVTMYAIMRPLTGVPTRNGWRVPFGGVGGLLIETVTAPWNVAAHFLDADRLVYLFQMTAPFLALFVLSAGLAAVSSVVLFVNVLSTYWYQHNIAYHYSIVAVPALLFATVHGVAALRPRAKHRMIGAVAVSSLLASVLWSPHNLSLSARETPSRENPAVVAAHDILASVPERASASFYDPLVPHAAHRTGLYFFPNPFRAHLYGVDGSLEGTRLPAADTVEYVVLPRFLLPDMQQLWDIEKGAFVVVADNEYWQVWRRAALVTPG